jgi:hypothetical protein
VEVVHVTVPGGLWRGGVRHTAARLRPVGPADDTFLLDTAEATAPAERAAALLARCVVTLGPGDTRSALRALAPGDHEALLLHLRRITLGERLASVVTCPAPACGASMDVTTDVSDLLLPPYEHWPETYERDIEDGTTTRRLRLRPPGRDDIDAVAALAARDPESAGAALAARCVVALCGGDDELAGGALSTPVAAAVSNALAELDPQAELELTLHCPTCGHRFEVVLDTARYFLAELDARLAERYREVHLLAAHYHWSERDILALPPGRRRRYLALIAGAGARASIG